MREENDGWSIAAAEPREAAVAAEVERAAGLRFAAQGLPEIATAEPTPEPLLAAAAREGRLLLLHDPDGKVAGFALCDEKDGTAYLAELAVHPRAQGGRRGAALVEAAAAWGRRRGKARLSLSTFRDIPWNGPYYRRLGFEPMPADAVGSELRAVRDREIANGLEGARREFLWRPV